MTEKEIFEYIASHPEEAVRYVARDNLEAFARYLNPKLEMTELHSNYYRILDMFAHKRIRRLIVSMHPQVGKSEGSSRMLPQFILGLNPDAKIVIGSYTATVSQAFNRDIQRGIGSPEYASLFPDTMINSGRKRIEGSYQCNAETTEIIGHEGFVKAVGRGGSLTGTPADVAILDDVYKDFSEANSESVRNEAWKWYTAVVKARLREGGQELIVFTRWHEDDIIGRIERSGERIILAEAWKDLEGVPYGAWVMVNFPAIKRGRPTELDPRPEGREFWPSMHPLRLLLEKKRLDPNTFECLYQGNPGNAEGRLYGEWKTYSERSEWGRCIRKGCYIDVADEGDDFLAAVCYDVYMSSHRTFNAHTRKWESLVFCLVTDIIYTQESTDVTYVSTPAMLNMNGTQTAWVESNSGGSQFGKNISPKTGARVVMFHQSGNKESRIVSNAAEVNARIVFPVGWETRWPLAAEHLRKFLRAFKANSTDDIEDALTGIYEKEIMGIGGKRYRGSARGIRRVN